MERSQRGGDTSCRPQGVRGTKEPSGVNGAARARPRCPLGALCGKVPETLDSLTSKEHHGINNMLQPRGVVSAGGPLEITDVSGR